MSSSESEDDLATEAGASFMSEESSCEEGETQAGRLEEKEGNFVHEFDGSTLKRITDTDGETRMGYYYQTL